MNQVPGRPICARATTYASGAGHMSGRHAQNTGHYARIHIGYVTSADSHLAVYMPVYGALRRTSMHKYSYYLPGSLARGCCTRTHECKTYAYPCLFLRTCHPTLAPLPISPSPLPGPPCRRSRNTTYYLPAPARTWPHARGPGGDPPSQARIPIRRVPWLEPLGKQVKRAMGFAVLSS